MGLDGAQSARRLERFRVFIGCVALGVAALTGITLLAQALGDGLAIHGRRILGGDIAISRMQRPATAEELAFFKSLGQISSTLNLRAMIRTSTGKAGLAEVKAVDDSYPALGAVVLSPPLPLAQALAEQDGLFGAGRRSLALCKAGTENRRHLSKSARNGFNCALSWSRSPTSSRAG